LAVGAGLVLLLDLRVIVRVFSALVVAMSGLFLASLVLAPVDWAAALRGLAVPGIPSGGTVRVLALVGTTVVTYNLFLHPSTARRHWADASDRRAAWRSELRGMAIFLPIGGLTSFAILAAGATLQGATGASEAGDVAMFAAMLEPVAGPAARWCFGLGLLAAGLTSAITAPLAAAAGVCELFGWEQGAGHRRYRLVWGSVLVTGLAFALTGLSPLPAIIAAQAANGVLLPFVGAFVLWLTVRQEVVQIPLWYRALGGVVTLVCAGLGIRTLLWVWQQI
jgi:Mn2+/Fe2+ NRAMP family transporter